MKTRIALSLILLIGFTSCIKDHIGHGSEDVALTAENHLSAGSLYQQFATEEIERLDELIDKLGQISPNNPDYDQAQKDIEEAEGQLAEFNINLQNLVDIYSVADIPRPCPNSPTGKCVPVRLEYFVFPSNVVNALVSVESSADNYEGVSNKLEPLDGFESDLQFIRIPIEFIDSELTIRMLWKDNQGNEYNLESIHKN